MRVPHGVTITVTRSSARDAVGDTVPDSSWQVPKVAVDWSAPSAQAPQEFRDQSVAEIILFVPRTSPALRQGDAITLPGGSRWHVIGQPMFDQAHPLTGTDFGYVEVKVREVH